MTINKKVASNCKSEFLIIIFKVQRITLKNLKFHSYNSNQVTIILLRIKSKISLKNFFPYIKSNFGGQRSRLNFW